LNSNWVVLDLVALDDPLEVLHGRTIQSPI
jgi:hypothetical protein